MLDKLAEPIAKALARQYMMGFEQVDEPVEWERNLDEAKDLVRHTLTVLRDIDLDTQNDVEVDMLIKGRAVLPEFDEPMQEDALNCWKAMLDALLAGD